MSRCNPPVLPFGRSAVISRCRRYRYELRRRFACGHEVVCFIMLNPSTADGERDDNTITRCMRFAYQWNIGELVVVNLFALRSTNPFALLAEPYPVGEENDRHIVRAAESAELVVCAWGAHGVLLDRDLAVLELLRGARLKKPTLLCLGTTAEGHPRHPGRIGYSTPLEPFFGRDSKEA